MSKGLYAITAIVEGKPVGAFVLGMNADDAAHKSFARLGESGRMTHLYRLCDATPATLKRNQLLKFCPEADQIEFVTDTLLEIVDAMQRQVANLKFVVSELMKAEPAVPTTRFQSYAFSISALKNAEGKTDYYHTMAPDFGTAFRVATNFAKSEFGPDAVVGFMAIDPEEEEV